MDIKPVETMVLGEERFSKKCDPVIIERTIGLVRGPSTAMYSPFLEHCTLTFKEVGTIRRDLSKPPQRRQGPDPRLSDC